MTRALLLIAIVLSLTVPIANAGAASRDQHKRHHQKAVRQAPQPQVFVPWQAPATSSRRGPPWAMPNECYNDEGNGRWMPCANRP